MGFFDDLLSGAALVGNIAQTALSFLSADGKPVFVAKDGTRFSDTLKTGYVTFFGELDSTGTIFSVNASNDPTNDVPAVTVCIPNDGNADSSGKQYSGVQYTIPQGNALAIGEILTNSPLLNVTCGAVSGSDTPDGPGSNMIKIAFNNLKIGSSINVGSFTLSCTTSQLTVLCTTAVGITALGSYYFTSNRGITASTSTPIPKSGTADETDLFNIDFTSLGFDISQDELSGELVLMSASSVADIEKLSKTKSKPFTQAQKEYFMHLNQMKTGYSHVI